MIGESVSGMVAVQVAHQAVAVHLRDDARRSDGDALRVALDDRLLRDGEVAQAARVEQHVLRRRREGEHRAAQSEQSRVVDVDRIDLRDFRAADAHRHAAGADLRFERVPLLGRQLLGVVHALDARSRPEDYRGGDHRPGERRHPNFVDARHQRQPLLPERLLERAKARQPPAFRLRGVDAPQDPLGDRAGAGAGVLPERGEPSARKLFVAVRVPLAELFDRHRPQIVESAHHAVLGCRDSIRFLKFASKPGSCCSASIRSTIEGTSAPSFRSIL